MTYLDLARRGRRRKDHDRRLVGSLLLALAVCLAGLSFHIRPATADDGSLETQKGGLFHRKGFIFPEIHRRKELPKTPASTTTATQPPNALPAGSPLLGPAHRALHAPPRRPRLAPARAASRAALSSMPSAT